MPCTNLSHHHAITHIFFTMEISKKKGHSLSWSWTLSLQSRTQCQRSQTLSFSVSGPSKTLLPERERSYYCPLSHHPETLFSFYFLTRNFIKHEENHGSRFSVGANSHLFTRVTGFPASLKGEHERSQNSKCIKIISTFCKSRHTLLEQVLGGKG